MITPPRLGRGGTLLRRGPFILDGCFARAALFQVQRPSRVR